MDRQSGVHGDPRADARTHADELRHRRRADEVPHGLGEPGKIDQIREILAAHPGEPALVIGMYLDQLDAIARPLGLPVITGATPQKVRDTLYADFKSGKIRILAVSKVANFAVDLPKASLAIQVSGTFGSRQEEAQRLGRVLRPKEMANQAYFYSLVSRDTVEQEFALKRQLFLCEEGYAYTYSSPVLRAQTRAVPRQPGPRSGAKAGNRRAAPRPTPQRRRRARPPHEALPDRLAGVPGRACSMERVVDPRAQSFPRRHRAGPLGRGGSWG